MEILSDEEMDDVAGGLDTPKEKENSSTSDHGNTRVIRDMDD